MVETTERRVEKRFVCANSLCEARVYERAVTVEVRDLWHCGDHDERVLTGAFVVCSMTCLVAASTERASSLVFEDEAPF
jgi:hypothetical protein